VARYELLIDGARRWKASSEDDVRAWLREYCEEHVRDDPDAVHVQIRRLSAWSWLTGGKLVGRQQFLVVLAALAFAAPAPAQATLKPGDTAAIDVSVATLWKAPNLYRAIDRPSVGNPVDPVQWSDNLATTASRVWLDSHVQTQALYAQTVTVLTVRGGWAKVAVRDEPDPQDAHGYPGWLPRSQLATDFEETGSSMVVVARTGVVQLDSGRKVTLSYGTHLPVTGESVDRRRWLVRTPDGPGTIARGALAPSYIYSGASIVAQAKRFLGVHYLWGGLSAWGYDCSGIIWAVYRAHGMTIPRDADPQFRHGTAVSLHALRPGDLLFYGTQRYVHHVSIYAGAGRMLEAPDSAHRVRLVPVRYGGLVGARRYTRE
jgi:gamma-D-glutamyl-L-lysine dipeptidyl-peptidase